MQYRVIASILINAACSIQLFTKLYSAQRSILLFWKGVGFCGINDIFLCLPLQSKIYYASSIADLNLIKKTMYHKNVYLQVGRILIAAHSMGGRILVKALEKWQRALGNSAMQFKFAFFAPDVPQKEFTSVLDHCKEVSAENAVLLASKKDAALIVSSGIPKHMDFEPKAGKALALALPCTILMVIKLVWYLSFLNVHNPRSMKSTPISLEPCISLWSQRS